MLSLKITAYLSTPLVAFDDHSPSLDSLLEWLLLDRHGLTTPNPTAAQVEATRELVQDKLPLASGDIGNQWYWQVSGPCYRYQVEQIDKFRKRWDYQEHNLNWGKRKPKWDTSQGGEKSYDLPLFLRLTPAITWFAIGDRDGIIDLLQDCPGIGKKRSYGYGQITRWDVVEHSEDWHLWGPGDALMRPIPCQFIDRNCDFGIQDWGWRPPAWLVANKTRCAMPVHTVKMED